MRVGWEEGVGVVALLALLAVRLGEAVTRELSGVVLNPNASVWKVRLQAASVSGSAYAKTNVKSRAPRLRSGRVESLLISSSFYRIFKLFV